MQFTAMTVPFRELSLWGSGMWETLMFLAGKMVHEGLCTSPSYL